MAALVVTALESSITEAGAPTAAQIDAAWSAVDFAPDVRAGVGAWAYPQPRIVRTVPLGSFRTTASNVWVTPNNIQPSVLLQLRSSLRDALAAQLATIGDWETPTLGPFNAATNGSLQWWQSGQAAVTRTRDAFPTGVARGDAVEPAAGPSRADLVPSSPGSILSSIQSSPLLWLAGGAVVLYIAWPWIAGARRHAAS